MINESNFDIEDVDLDSSLAPQGTRTLQITNMILSVATVFVLTLLLPALHWNWLGQYRMIIVWFIVIATPVNFIMFENDLRRLRGKRPLRLSLGLHLEQHRRPEKKTFKTKKW